MLRTLLTTPYKLLRPVIDLRRIVQSIPAYRLYLKDLREYKRQGGSIPLRYLAPYIYQKDATHSFDAHYTYQSTWAFSLILASETKHHIDVGSEVKFVAMMSRIIETTFIDIRPLEINLSNFHSKAGSALELPYKDGTIESLSSLHVIEHIGLGRYGDPIDPDGTVKAAKELSRVLAPGGNLYISLPIGQPRLMFNAQRIHSTHQVLQMFDELKLVEISAVTDKREFIRHSSVVDLDQSKYACGMFWFTK